MSESPALPPPSLQEIASILSIKGVAELERRMLRSKQVDCPVTHKFGPGIYIREIFLPAGAFAVGHRQKTEHYNHMLSGHVIMITQNGPCEIMAPFERTLPPGRKIGYIIEDTVWQNIYATDEQDVSRLEEMFLDKSPTLSEAEQQQYSSLIGIKEENDRADYYEFLKEVGLTEESENQNNMMDLPFGDYKIRTAKSRIEGTGLFATGNFNEGEVIAPARIGDKRTIAGRFPNHSPLPNAVFLPDSSGKTLYLVAASRIQGMQGGFKGDEITVNYRDSLKILSEGHLG